MLADRHKTIGVQTAPRQNCRRWYY